MVNGGSDRGAMVPAGTLSAHGSRDDPASPT